MRLVVGKREMQAMEKNVIEEIGIPSLVLMERAALAVCEQARSMVTKEESIWVLCGSGNNGADGIAAARMLDLLGYSVTLLVTGDGSSGSIEYRKQLEIATKLGLSIVSDEDFISCRKCSLLIDALFGIGLSREIEGELRKRMEELREKEIPKVLAVDLPSGVHADTGAWLGPVIPADVTVTFGWEKRGMAVYPGRTACGKIVIADIGFPEWEMWKQQPKAYTLEKEDLGQLPQRRADSNKGSFGKVLIVAGSKNMSGAAYLSALAAYRSGAGLVRILTDESNRQILQSQLPEAILSTYTPEELDREEAAVWAEELCSWASVIVIGPGLSREAFARKLLGLVLENAYVPIILDADGLNAVADFPHLSSYFTDNIIVTPHLGEMARLTGKEIKELRANLYQAARDYSDQYGVTCVLKDAATVVAFRDGTLYVNESGCSAMAKAGSGDVLTGILAGLLACSLEEKQAISLGVYVHGLAGERAAQSCGDEGMLARDLANEVGKVLMERKKKER
ncbi:MAG: NAD(P)H-hydrate dehydratase [bacterium]|nr:NAD(P)H-hydrate dehydratase [bacterium]